MQGLWTRGGVLRASRQLADEDAVVRYRHMESDGVLNRVPTEPSAHSKSLLGYCTLQECTEKGR